MNQDFKEMQWDEFKVLLAGISPDTALGRIVSIRAEDDKNILDNFTLEQHKIRNEWRKRRAQNKTDEERNAFLDGLKEAFIKMAGGD